MPIFTTRNDAKLLSLLKGFNVPVIPDLAPSGKAWYSTCSELKSNICKLFNFVRDDYFYILVITGPPGSGKSTLASQIGSDFDPSFVVENLCVDNKEFSQRFSTLPKHSCIVYDEGTLGLYSRDAMGIANRILNKSFMIGREKIKGMIIICIPDFLTVDSNIREHLVNGLIEIKRRGYFSFYNGKSARYIGKMKTFKLTSPIFRGCFTKSMPFAAEYHDKKIKGVTKFLKQSVTQGLLSIVQVAEQLKVSPNKVRHAINNGVISAERTGNGTVNGRGHYYIKTSDVYKLRIAFAPKKVSKLPSHYGSE